MRMLRTSGVALLALMIMLTPALAAESVLSRIPAGTIGFFATKNVADLSGKIDQLMSDIGLAGMVPPDLIGMLKMQAGIGEGFNDDAGFAIAFLNPELLGVSFEEMMDGAMDEPPIAMIMPGTNAAAMFPNFALRTEGDMQIASMNGYDTAFVKTVGDYTFVSPTAEALQNATEAKALMAGMDEASKKFHGEVIEMTDAVVWIDAQAMQPAIDAAFEKIAEEIASEMGSNPMMAQQAEMFNAVLPVYRDMLRQVDALSMGIRMTQPGVSLEVYAGLLPDSLMGRVLTGLTPKGAARLDALPDTNWVLALGFASHELPEDLQNECNAFTKEMMGAMLKSMGQGGLPEEQLDAVMANIEALNKQIGPGQISFGGGPEGAGVFGMAMVFESEEPEALVQVFADMLKSQMDLGMSMLPAGMGDQPNITMEYMENVGTLDGATVHALQMNISGPEGEPMPPEAEQMMTAVFGEPQLRYYMTAVDGKAVVTYGGGMTMLEQAVKAARTGGPIGNDPDVMGALKPLPANPMIVGVFSPSNLLTAVQVGANTVAGPSGAMMLGTLAAMQLETKTPVSFGAAVRGSGVRKTLWIPTPMVGEIVQKAMMIHQQMMGGYQEEPEGEDF